MDTRAYNEELEKAVKANQVEKAELLLKNGANPDYIVKDGDHHQTPVLFLSPSRRMTNLLLQCGANPNMEECSQYSVFGQVALQHISILQKSALNHHYENIITLAEHEPCTIHNSNINAALLLLLKENNNESLSPDFSWESKKGKAILALIRISVDLKHVITSSLIFRESPLSFAVQNKNTALFKRMIDNNYILLEDLIYEKDLDGINQANNEFVKLLDTPLLEKTFDSFFIIFQLLQLGTRENKSPVYNIPKDILNLIMGIILDSKIECSLNYSLSSKMQDFIIINQILKSGHYSFSWDIFLEQNAHLSPFGFFYRAKREATQNKKGLTAITLELIKENNVNPENENLVNSIFHHCIKHKDVSPESQTEIKATIQKRLRK